MSDHNDFIFALAVGTLVTILVAAVVVIMFTLTESRTQAILESGKTFDECVQREYGMTVYQYENLTGEFPVCNN